MEKLQPKDVLSKFLKCWKKKNWKKMTRYCQKTWLGNHANPTNELSDMFDSTELLDWEIVGIIENTGANTNIKVKANFGALGSNIGRVRLICENAPFKPNVDGDWGVNPISATNIIGLI